MPAFIAVNKVDLIDKETYLDIEHDVKDDTGISPFMISAHSGYHMEELKDAIYDCLGFMRIYLKPQSGDANLEEPLIIRIGSTVETVCPPSSTGTSCTGTGMPTDLGEVREARRPAGGPVAQNCSMAISSPSSSNTNLFLHQRRDSDSRNGVPRDTGPPFCL